MGTASTVVVAGTGARRTKASALRGWPRLQVLYGVICPPAAALIILAFWPMWRDRPLLALGSVVLSMALLSAGILLLDEPSQQRSAGMLIGASALLTAGWLNNWQVGPLPLISVPTSPAGTVLAAWAMYSYPHSPNEERAGKKRFFGVMLGSLLAAVVAGILVSRPQWYGFPAGAWWPALLPSRTAFQAVSLVFDLAGVGFAVAYMLLWLGRWRRSRGISRRLAKPVASAASVTCAATGVELVATALSASPHTMNLIYTVEVYLQIGVPAAFVVSVLQRRFARTRVADLILHLRGPARVSSITSALRDILEDPGLEVVESLEVSRQAPPAGGQAGHPRTGIPVSAGGRTEYPGLPVTATSGDQLAVIVADPSLSMDDDLVRAAVAATAFALENAQLEAALTDQLREVHQSRLRIIQAETTERRRLERDLHDGTQQRLVAISIMLGAAEADTTEEPVRAILSRAGTELAQVIEGLRDLAHGIHPGVLHQVGLEKAIRSMAEQYPFPIDVALPPGRFSEGAELTAYYVIAEAISNAVKHARARRITITGKAAGGWLSIAVSDDGQGGARADAGTGISGIIDRVRAIDGEASVDSAPGHGTRIWARIPCA